MRRALRRERLNGALRLVGGAGSNARFVLQRRVTEVRAERAEGTYRVAAASRNAWPAGVSRSRHLIAVRNRNLSRKPAHDRHENPHVSPRC
jgi:hypothetical protein